MAVSGEMIETMAGPEDEMSSVENQETKVP